MALHSHCFINSSKYRESFKDMACKNIHPPFKPKNLPCWNSQWKGKKTIFHPKRWKFCQLKSCTVSKSLKYWLIEIPLPKKYNISCQTLLRRWKKKKIPLCRMKVNFNQTSIMVLTEKAANAKKKKKSRRSANSQDHLWAYKPTEVANVHLVKLSVCLWKMGEKYKVISSRAPLAELEHYMLKGKETVLLGLSLLFLAR